MLREAAMLIECDTCAVRNIACGDCVVPELLGTPIERLEIDAAERRALEVLAAAGLVPKLRWTVDIPAGEPARKRAS
jgi:hypothetical protein